MWQIIDTYTRAEAIADGLQIQCPEPIRQEAGIRFPVFFTTTLWNEYILPPKTIEGEGQSLDGRLWDVLYMWYFNVKARKPEGNTLFYDVIFRMPRKNKPHEGKNVTVRLKSVIGPTDFDNPAPAITIMLPGED